MEKSHFPAGAVSNLFGMFASRHSALHGYLQLSELFGRSGLQPVEQQIVLLTTSLHTDCDYCKEAHGAVARMMNLDEAVVTALCEGESLKDPKLEALRQFTAKVVKHRGRLETDQIEAFLRAGYSRAHVLAIILGVLHLLSFPFGTALGVYALYVLLNAEAPSIFGVQGAVV